MKKKTFDTALPLSIYKPLVQDIISPIYSNAEDLDIRPNPEGYDVGHVKIDNTPPPLGYVLVRFSLLAVVLGMLAWSIGSLQGWQLASTTVVFAALLLMGWFFLSLVDLGHFPFSLRAALNYFLESQKISTIERVHNRQMQRDEFIATQKAETRKFTSTFTAQLTQAADRQLIEQVEHHSQPQSTMNQVANYVVPNSEQFIDEFRNELLRFLVSLYEMDELGNYMRLNKDGRIINVTVPWSARGSMTPTESQKALAMLNQAGMLCWVVKKEKNAWYFNAQHYSTPGKVVRAFETVRTPK